MAAFCLIRTPQLPGNWARPLGMESDVPGNCFMGSQADPECFAVVKLPVAAGKLLGVREPLARARQLFYGLPKATCHATSRHFGWLRLTPFWCGNKWCRLPARKLRKPSAAAAFCLTRAPQLPGNWARPLGMESDVPGNCFMGSGRRRARQR